MSRCDPGGDGLLPEVPAGPGSLEDRPAGRAPLARRVQVRPFGGEPVPVRGHLTGAPNFRAGAVGASAGRIPVSHPSCTSDALTASRPGSGLPGSALRRRCRPAAGRTPGRGLPSPPGQCPASPRRGRRRSSRRRGLAQRWPGVRRHYGLRLPRHRQLPLLRQVHRPGQPVRALAPSP